MFKWYKKVFFSINQTTLVFLEDMMAMWLTDNNLPGYYVGKMVPWSYFLFHFLLLPTICIWLMQALLLDKC